MKSLSNQYRYYYLTQNAPTTCTVIDGVNEGDRQIITFGNYINLLEEYAAYNVESTMNYSSAIWVNGSSTLQNPQQIEELTKVSGVLTNHNPPHLTNQCKAKMRDRMYNNFMVYQIMSILDKYTVRAILLHRNNYT